MPTAPKAFRRRNGLAVLPMYQFPNADVRQKAKGLDRASKLVHLRADGLLAQTLENEIGLLNSILYMDHLKEHRQLVRDEPEAEEARAEAVVV